MKNSENENIQFTSNISCNLNLIYTVYKKRNLRITAKILILKKKGKEKGRKLRISKET